MPRLEQYLAALDPAQLQLLGLGEQVALLRKSSEQAATEQEAACAAISDFIAREVQRLDALN